MQLTALLVALMSCISNDVLVILITPKALEAIDGRIGRLMAEFGDGGARE